MKQSQLYNLFIFLLLILFYTKGSAQNLIANPSFEQINYCCEYGSKCAPQGWFNANLTGINSMIFVERAKTDFGKRCIQLRLVDLVRMSKRQYAFTPLLCKLVKDEEYHFSIWVRADFNAVEELHIILGDSMYVRFEDKTINAEPSITLKGKKRFIFDKKGKWINLTSTYKANGTEQYLTIGYLTPDEKIEFKPLRNGARYAFMTIDSISLTPINSRAECDLDAERKKYFSEGRRHLFHIPCGGDTAYNMFPFLLNDSFRIQQIPQEAYVEERQVKISRNLMFDFDKSDLLPASFPVLDSIVDDLMYNTDLSVKISGHTDDSGNPEYNLQLSNNRAKAVADYMIYKGITHSRIEWKGFGDKQPVADNSTELGRATNRRVEFEFQLTQ